MTDSTCSDPTHPDYHEPKCALTSMTYYPALPDSPTPSTNRRTPSHLSNNTLNGNTANQKPHPPTIEPGHLESGNRSARRRLGMRP